MIMHDDNKVITDEPNNMNDFILTLLTRLLMILICQTMRTDMSLHDFVEKCCAYHASHPSVINVRAHTSTDFHFDIQLFSV